MRVEVSHHRRCPLSAADPLCSCALRDQPTVSLCAPVLFENLAHIPSAHPSLCRARSRVRSTRPNPATGRDGVRGADNHHPKETSPPVRTPRTTCLTSPLGTPPSARIRQTPPSHRSQ